MEELIDIKFGNMESKEEEPLSIISTGNILGKIIEVEQQIGDNANLVEEINLDDKSERSVVSRQDVSDMIMENNNMLMLRINDRFDDVNNRFKRMDNRFDNMNEKFDYMVNTIHIMMAKLQGTSFQAVSNDKLLSDHISGFIKDPNLVEENVKQIIDEKIDSVLGEVVEKANKMEKVLSNYTLLREKTFMDARSLLIRYDSDKSDQDKKLDEMKDTVEKAVRRVIYDSDTVRREEFVKLKEMVSPKGFSPGLDGRQYVLMEDFKLFRQSYDQNARQIKQRLIDTAYQHSSEYEKISKQVQALSEQLSIGVTKTVEMTERMEQLELNSVIDLSHSFVNEGDGVPSALNDSSGFQRLMEEHKATI